MNLFCSRGSVHLRIVATIAALVVVHTANAQTGVIWATDAWIGGSHGMGGEFVSRSTMVAEIAASVRKDVRHGVGLDVEFGYDWNIDTSNQLVCALDSRGNCMSGFPGVGGQVGLVGVTLGAADAVQLRVNAGMAAYNIGNTRLGAPMTAIDVAAAPSSWLALVAGGRAFELPNYRGDRLTAITWHFGLRMQTHR
jgi:hypothetical protein